MNSYVNTLVDSILDGSRSLQDVNAEEELVKMGLAFARDHIVMQEAADEALSVDLEAGQLYDDEGIPPSNGGD